MAARLSSKSNGAQVKLLKMVNDQRARCKLTTLDNVMDHTGYSWVESMIEHARDLFNDHSSSALSEMDMNVNILRSPKKDRAKRVKKAAPSKKASPYKKSRLPKESTPPRQSPKKIVQLSSAAVSPRSSTSTKVADRESVASSIKAAKLQAAEEVTAKEDIVEIDLRTPEGKTHEAVRVNADISKKQEPTRALETAPEEVEVSSKGSERKRKSQGSIIDEKPTKRQSPRRSSDITAVHGHEQQMEEEPQRSIDETFDEAAAIPGGFIDEPAAKTSKPVERISPFKSDNYSIIAETTEDLSDDMEAEDEEEVSRVMTKEIEVKSALTSPARPIATGDVTKERVGAPSVVEMATPIAVPRASLTESVDSNGTRSTRNDDVFSDAEPEVAPSNTASKPTLRERIDRLRSMFSPAARPTSSIPRLSPPKLMQSPPRPIFSRGDSISSKASSKSTSPSMKSASSTLKTGSFSRPPSPSKSPSKSPFMSPPKAPAMKAAVKASTSVAVPLQPIKIASTSSKVTSKPIQTIKVSGPVQSAHMPIPPIRFASISASSAASNPLATAPVIAAPIAPVVTPAVIAPKAAPTAIVSVSAPAPPVVKAVKAAPQPKPIVVSAPVATLPPKAAPTQPLPAISMANPFQKAQQQQQQQALATTSTLRVKQGPPPSTAHIELEEPDSAYSDSDDEETVRRRQQHKPWETREGLAKALEEQAHVDADMIFGIPHGAVPIDEILPAETEYAKQKRARPRSSSATWSRDGLKQIEIDRYNERMGIQGPGVLLPLTVQDDGSGTPSRAHRLSAIAQSAISQGQFSRKPSQSNAGRGTLSPTRPSAVTSSIIRNGGSQLLNGSNFTQSNVKYPSLQAGTPTRSKPSINGSVPASTQKSKVVKPAASNASLQSTKSTTKNVFQGASQPVKAPATSTKKKV